MCLEAEESTEFPRTGIAEGRELPRGCWGPSRQRMCGNCLLLCSCHCLLKLLSVPQFPHLKKQEGMETEGVSILTLLPVSYLFWVLRVQQGL